MRVAARLSGRELYLARHKQLDPRIDRIRKCQFEKLTKQWRNKAHGCVYE